MTRAAPQYREHWGHMPNIFTRLFGRQPSKPNTTHLEVTGRTATFATFGGDAYGNDVYRSGVDAIARIAAKFVLQPTVTFTDGTTAKADERLARILQVEPNPLMTAYDMNYQLYTHLYTTNNAFCYLQRDAGQIVAAWPLHVTSCELAQAMDGRTVCALTFANGRSAILDYHDVVHLRRHFNSSDVMGDTNEAIRAGVELADAQNKGITASIRTSGSIRGIVKYTSALGPSKLAEYRRHFEEANLNPDNAGVILTDQSIDFVPVNDNRSTVNAADVEQARAKILGYLGTNEAIANGTFDDDAFGAFEESTLEALALQAALEWTRKVYSSSQVARGRRIECDTSRIRYIGTRTRVDLLKVATPMGILSINEARDLMGLAPIEGGNKRLQSLNYVDADIASTYQLYSAGHGGIKSMDGKGGEQ